MIDPRVWRIPRGSPFWAFNAVALMFLSLFVIAPLLSHFSTRSEEISESASQLLHFQAITSNAKMLMARPAQSGDPFLPGSEERVVSADLQASLKAIVTDAGVRFLGVRGLQGSRLQQLQMVAVSLELEGSLPAIRDAVRAIESHMPLLFVTSAVFRSVADADPSTLRAELKVQGAMRGNGPPGPAEAILP
jgi:general secretion pathway protein M